MARSIVILVVSGSTSTAGEGLASSGHRPEASQRAATERASGQKIWPVFRRLWILFMDPAATIGHPHRFHFLLRSSNSPEWDPSGWPPSHSWLCRRYRLRAIIDPILHLRCTPLHAEISPDL